MTPKMREEMNAAIRAHAALDDSIVRLIDQATWSLNFGPGCENDEGDDGEAFPGFETACERIREALDQANVRSSLYVDMGGEPLVLDHEPDQYEDCYECDGTGEANADEEASMCEPECRACNGSGRVEAFLEETYHVDSRDVKAAIVGKDLAEYV